MKPGYPGSGQWYFLHLNPRQDGYYNTVNIEVTNNIFNPPCGGNINSINLTLKYKTRQVINYSPYDGASESESKEDMNDDSEHDNNQERNGGNDQNQR